MSRGWDFLTPRTEGTAARQAHTLMPGQKLFERELGREGFFGAAVEFYHRNPPTAWTEIGQHLKPRLLDTAPVRNLTGSPWDAAELFANASMRMRYWHTNTNMDHLVRNADGDDLLFMHGGAAELYCDFGHITLGQGDYFVIPRGTMWRIETSGTVDALLIESTGAPYSLARHPTLGRHAPFDTGVLGVPAINDRFRSQNRAQATELRIKRGQAIGTLSYPYNPLDAEGWQGDLYPVRLNIEDIRTIHSYRTHLPPSAYCTFTSPRFVVCTFMPYPSPTDHTALKIPAFHDNIDYDEIMFMHEGSKTHRTAAFKPGSMTYHPSGVTHGPHPKMLPLMQETEAPFAVEATYIMIDARDPLELGRDAPRCEVPDYGMSWIDSIDFSPDAGKQPAPVNELG